jgi:large subunit ribosomal protein LP1
MSSKAEQAVAYAALILADDSIPITPEKLQALLKAAGVEDVEPIWTALFAKALEGKDVKDILTKVATATGGATTATTEVEDGEDRQGANDGRKGMGDAGDDEGSDDDDDDDLGLGLFD